MLLWFAAIVIALLAVVAVARIPGARAQRRGNPRATWIALLGWVGVVAWPLWIVAYAWASRRPRRTAIAEAVRVRVTCRDRLAATATAVPQPARPAGLSSVPGRAVTGAVGFGQP